MTFAVLALLILLEVAIAGGAHRIASLPAIPDELCQPELYLRQALDAINVGPLRQAIASTVACLADACRVVTTTTLDEQGHVEPVSDCVAMLAETPTSRH